MPNTKSAKKELKKSIVKKAHNKRIKNNVKALIKKTLKAIETKNKKEAEDYLSKALKALDKAAQKGVIKKNTSNRKKSRLHAKLNNLSKT